MILYTCRHGSIGWCPECEKPSGWVRLLVEKDVRIRALEAALNEAQGALSSESLRAALLEISLKKLSEKVENGTAHRCYCNGDHSKFIGGDCCICVNESPKYKKALAKLKAAQKVIRKYEAAKLGLRPVWTAEDQTAIRAAMEN